jgi:hypothetical protein
MMKNMLFWSHLVWQKSKKKIWWLEPTMLLSVQADLLYEMNNNLHVFHTGDYLH